MASLSTHVLDTSAGRPAAGVKLRLERDGKPLAEAATDADGRAKLGSVDKGVYTLVFETGSYFPKGFYPSVRVEFTVVDDKHHHVPLLLSPFGYSTYRGS